VLRGRDVQDFEELKRQGLSIRAISRLTGYCRKTVRKYLIQPDTVPVYGPRSKQQCWMYKRKVFSPPEKCSRG